MLTDIDMWPINTVKLLTELFKEKELFLYTESIEEINQWIDDNYVFLSNDSKDLILKLKIRQEHLRLFLKNSQSKMKDLNEERRNIPILNFLNVR